MKKSEQEVTITINVTPEQAWEVIGSVKNVDKWFPEMITSCRIEGTTRICGTEQGNLIEEILKVDHENKEFKYAITEQPIIPNIHNIIGNAKVMSGGNGKAVINWRWEFEFENTESEKQAKETFAGAGNMAIKGLETYLIKEK